MSLNREPLPLPARRRIWIAPAMLSAVIVGLWIFPSVWYTRGGAGSAHWFHEQEAVPGWRFVSEPVSAAAEAILVGDKLVNGEFVGSSGEAVRVFSAKRYRDNPNEIGLFMHTPDRCWTQIGWRIEPSEPEVIQVNLHGVRIAMERRIFENGGHRELVYFAGLVGGEPLPYRLDHHLSIAERYGDHPALGRGAALRASDRRFWERLWESFASRREFLGPKHFFRVSTEVRGPMAAADERLQKLLPLWLEPMDYQQERAAWQASQRRADG